MYTLICKQLNGCKVVVLAVTVQIGHNHCVRIIQQVCILVRLTRSAFKRYYIHTSIFSWID